MDGSGKSSSRKSPAEDPGGNSRGWDGPGKNPGEDFDRRHPGLAGSGKDFDWKNSGGDSRGWDSSGDNPGEKKIR